MTSQTQPSSQRHQPTLPLPQTFDILPPLHELLSRIDHASSTSTTTVNNTAASPNDNDDDNAIIGASYGSQNPLEPKDLPNEVLPIKNKCKRIPREVEKLPDIERSVEEQREEIRNLEEGIVKRREVLERVARAADGLRGGLR